MDVLILRVSLILYHMSSMLLSPTLGNMSFNALGLYAIHSQYYNCSGLFSVSLNGGEVNFLPVDGDNRLVGTGNGLTDNFLL